MIVNAIFLLVGQLLCFFLITFFGYSQVFLSKVWLANHWMHCKCAYFFVFLDDSWIVYASSSVKDEWFNQFSLYANHVLLNERFIKTGEINMFWFFIGCLQSLYGIHTFRVESIVRGKAAPVDELQVQGVADPGVLRKVLQTWLVILLSYFTVNVLVFETRWAGYKLAITMHFLQVIITEASKNVQDFGKGWNPTLTIEEEGLSRVGSLNEGPAVFKSPPKSWKVI